MADHGLIRRGWTFAFNRRRRTMGLCNYTDKRIELSVLFVTMNDAGLVRDTILHEIAHALAGHRAGHGPVWAAVCRRLGVAPLRACTEAAMPRGAIRAKCPSCGLEHDRHRRPMKGRTYYCLACGPKRGRLAFSPHTSRRFKSTARTLVG